METIEIDRTIVLPVKEKDLDLDNEIVNTINYLTRIKVLEQEIERLNNKEEQLIKKLEDLIIVGEQVENEWAVDICKMIIEELKGDGSNEKINQDRR